MGSADRKVCTTSSTTSRASRRCRRARTTPAGWSSARPERGMTATPNGRPDDEAIDRRHARADRGSSAEPSLRFLGPGSVRPGGARPGVRAGAPGSPGRLLDLGSGGGAGLVLAARWPTSEVVLLGAAERRCAFLAESVSSLGWEDRVRWCGLGPRTPGAGRTCGPGSMSSWRGASVPTGHRRVRCAVPRRRGRLIVSEPPAGDGEAPDEADVGPAPRPGGRRRPGARRPPHRAGVVRPLPLPVACARTHMPGAVPAPHRRSRRNGRCSDRRPCVRSQGTTVSRGQTVDQRSTLAS